MELFQWYNLMFAGPFGLAVIYLIGLMSGLAPEGHDHDFEADVHVDVDADVDADLDHDLGPEHSPEFHPEHEPSFVSRVLSAAGVGRVPLSILLVSFFLLWGFAGMWSNALFKPILVTPYLYTLPATAIALLASVTGTGILGRTLARMLPSFESYASKRAELVGKRAEALFDITAEQGTARLRNQYGHLLDVPCRVREGTDRIPAGETILLAAYDRTEQCFTAAPYPQLGSPVPVSTGNRFTKGRVST